MLNPNEHHELCKRRGFPRHQSRGVLVSALACLAVFGCVAAQEVVPVDHAAKIRRIEVVALEPPPLLLPGEVSLTDLDPTSLRALGDFQRFTTVPIPRVQTGARVAVLLFGIVALAELAARDEPAHKRYQEIAKSPLPVETALREPQTWSPTMVAAGVAAEQLREMAAMNVTVNRRLALVPGVEERRPTPSMENWLSPIRAWYNADRASYSYAELAADEVDAVLEVGMANYEFFGDMFIFQIMIKLIDPKTGRVVGRTREATYQTVGPAEKLFEDDAKPFKKLFGNLTQLIVPTGLNKLGLIEPHAPFERMLTRAECGTIEAQELVAVSYHHGAGVGVDRVKAATWYRIAADRGSEYAATALDTMIGELSNSEDLEARRAASAWQPDSAACQAAGIE